jgi:hypothetical protein
MFTLSILQLIISIVQLIISCLQLAQTRQPQNDDAE